LCDRSNGCTDGGACVPGGLECWQEVWSNPALLPRKVIGRPVPDTIQNHPESSEKITTTACKRNAALGTCHISNPLAVLTNPIAEGETNHLAPDRCLSAVACQQRQRLADYAMSDKPTVPQYSVEVCLTCDPVGLEEIGRRVSNRCPDCGAQLFGFKGTDAPDEP
jgi:hypothetical protein